MTRYSFRFLPLLAAAAVLLSGCVGARTEADPDRHPDKWKRHQMRHLYDGRHRH